MDHNQQSGQRRGHFHRGGRRGPDRRGTDRRQHAQASEGQRQPARSSEQVDVEQIMRDIRSRISQRHGIDLSAAQIQELAANRLEAILDPRSVNPSLLDQLRKAAGAPSPAPPANATPAVSTVDEESLFDSFFRRMLRPLLKLLFNPEPLVRALNDQARQNADAAAREAERDRRQAEWNALHYELLQRVVRESARNTIEVQNLALRIDSLAAKVDFNERRVRGLEGAGVQAQPHRQSQRHQDTGTSSREAPAPAQGVQEATPAAQDGAAAQGEGQRRRRRRRRGRRGGSGPDALASSSDPALQDETAADAGNDADDVADGPEHAEAEESAAPVAVAAAPVVPEGTVHGGAVHAAEPQDPQVVNPAPAAVTPALAPSSPADEPTDR